MQSPKICSSFVDNLICFMGTGMIEAMLEPHMKEKVNATQNEVGLAFAIYAVAYTVSGVGAGYVSISKHTFNKKIDIFGKTYMTPNVIDCCDKNHQCFSALR